MTNNVRGGRQHSDTQLIMIAWKLTSLLRVEERLLEAEYFARLMRRQRDSAQFGYCLNAFVSAARSVTFLLQKEMSKVPAFGNWWSQQQELLGQDRSARFFLKLRNYSQKEGRISLAGTGSRRGQIMRWSFRFAGTADSVPAELLQRDVAECCTEHVGKLASLVLACTEVFSFHSCPRRALTVDGMKALQFFTIDLGALLGFPPAWIEAGAGIPLEHQLRLLREHVDGLDFKTLRRLARNRPARPLDIKTESDSFGEEILTALVAQMEGSSRSSDVSILAREIFVRSCLNKNQDDALKDKPPSPGSSS